ncbi:anaerobic C4-dicarboxylate transporter DcuA [Leifsonia sp. 98AMF]|uniref:anaerobic C4-dicarboxylate transporter family protein n=1 Tax=unclassified Leifsonia TaxID=2663824 RepID=UPI00087BF17C|nr:MULTISPECIES: anaerobic C4-dicarboxylate transporter family protein [unclassified Leifsonia]SDH70161.1 anaerobic C4-dicarboxylate transporter DcuA [Leifsonia sp. 197AMF]SDI69710.1 anaerobic C4-dicarboxylate transporter DcuA [Leifsonia sp. 466MF]SDK21508.1 anaerobic C4-dicarboxylate transporter DcuA [Leifsonia sp. 157MF]SDN72073.1 anaerobic C4-dicarboxylate transporter DcuA [Leifsonia sp. 509MF]SEN36267.1 anaerobic C4-dicarboxylate transporter DcuA [Leifsonia sp. 467MF]
MDIALVIIQACVVIGAIVLGVRTGGIGLGLWGVVGTAILVFVFRLPPGSPPIDAFFIIIAVITASSAMQAAGGIDYLVSIASKIIQRNPRRLTYVAPLVAFVFTVLSGTSNIFFALIPVIYETAYRNGQRPERALAASTVTSGLGITASPVSAAMAAYLVLMESKGFGLTQVLVITIPSAIVACIVTSFVQQGVGKELLNDPAYLKRVESGAVELPAALETQYAEARAGGGATPTAVKTGRGAGSGRPGRLSREEASQIEHPVPPGGATAAWIFVAGTLLVVLLGLFPGLRPAFPDEEGELVPIPMATVIEMVMFTAALVIILVRKVKPSLVVEQPLLRAGYVAAVALFGIAWMADTFISANEETIIKPLGELIQAQPLLLAVALFLVCGLTTSQSATTNTLIPIALAAGLAPGIITAMWPSLIGVWLFPANGSQIAAVETDRTGTTKLTQVPVWHSFTIPMLVSWVAVVLSGLLIQLVVPR